MRETVGISKLRLIMVIAMLSLINSNVIDYIFSQRDSDFIYLNNQFKYSYSKNNHQYLLVVYGTDHYNNKKKYDGIKIKFTPPSTDLPPYNKNVTLALNFIDKFFTIEYDNKCLNRWDESVSSLSVDYMTKNYDALTYFILPRNKSLYLTYIFDIAMFLPFIPTELKEEEENYEGSGRDEADSIYLKQFNTAQIMIDPIHKNPSRLNLRFIGYEINDLIPKREDDIWINNQYFYPDDKVKCNLPNN